MNLFMLFLSFKWSFRGLDNNFSTTFIVEHNVLAIPFFRLSIGYTNDMLFLAIPKNRNYRAGHLCYDLIHFIFLKHREIMSLLICILRFFHTTIYINKKNNLNTNISKLNINLSPITFIIKHSLILIALYPIV